MPRPHSLSESVSTVTKEGCSNIQKAAVTHETKSNHNGQGKD